MLAFTLNEWLILLLVFVLGLLVGMFLLAGGKWKHIMSSNPRKRPIFQKPSAAPRPATPRAATYTFEAEKPDRATAGEILEILQLLNKDFGKTIVMVTHDPEAAKYAKLQLHLDKGKFVENTASLQEA